MAKNSKAFNANIREVMKLRAGREFIWAILAECGIYNDCFTGNSHGMYLEGRRSIGLNILEMLEQADPTIYPRLLLEKQEQEADNG